MKAAVLVAVGSIAAVAAVVGASLWLRHETEALADTELVWIRDYYAAGSCADIPAAPTDSLRRVVRLARRACRGEASSARVDRIIQARLFFNRALPSTTEVRSESHIDPRLGRIAGRLAGVNVEARCWSDDDWRRVNKELLIVYPQVDYWAIGRADPNGRIHLLGVLCRPLARFFGSDYTPAANIERAELAEALLVLAHEAEHQRDFSRPEAAIECFALQRVRQLARQYGRSAAFAADVAAYAWNVSYPHGDPIYGTRQCRNGGALDLRPRDDVWP